MVSPDRFQLLRLFQQGAPPSWFEQLSQEHGYEFRQEIQSLSVVVWLTIWQRLQGNRSLAAAVECLLHGGAGDGGLAREPASGPR